MGAVSLGAVEIFFVLLGDFPEVRFLGSLVNRDWGLDERRDIRPSRLIGAQGSAATVQQPE